MDCANCELPRVKFYCDNCLKSHITKFKTLLSSVSSVRDAHIADAKKALETISPAREQRATKAKLQEKIRDVQAELKRIKDANSKTQARLAELRASHRTRRDNLFRARRLAFMPPSAQSPPPTPQPTHTPTPSQDSSRAAIESLHRSLLDTALSLARARAGLVQELVEVFDVVEVGGRPSLGGRMGVKGEWNIVGSVLPVPGDIRRYPIDAINATLQHTLHFLTLLTYYLGIKLPFEVSWTGAVPGVGQPSIAAGKGGENGGWAAWTEPYPLHLEKEAQSLVKDMVEAVGSSLGQNVGSASGTSSPNRQGSGLPSPGANNDRNRQLSNESDKSKGDGDQTATFTTGFAMLLYNVAYLAHTQGVDVALSQSGEVLRNLWAVCCSLELGKRSHAPTHPSFILPPPTGPSFSFTGNTPIPGGTNANTSTGAFTLDFAQLLQAIASKPSKSSKSRHGRSTKQGGKTKMSEAIQEEDEDWALV